MGRAKRKRILRHMRTEKAQINLRIRAVCSGPSLSAKRGTGHYKIQMHMNEEQSTCDTYYAHARDDVNPHILRMHECTFLLHAVQMAFCIMELLRGQNKYMQLKLYQN